MYKPVVGDSILNWFPQYISFSYFTTVYYWVDAADISDWSSKIGYRRVRFADKCIWIALSDAPGLGFSTGSIFNSF